ncbi:DNA-binding protein [Kibdelosporangium phytohabitans]|uniref:DNA-binding protein n=1 Tax=Kibdelosporangium phytohabitans TaxID=860235 RepID=A0A0N9I7C8_9PSEU|nr:DNA-binding protein [Kibdelosporangium phytohabitans]
MARWELALRLRKRREQVGIDVRKITQVLGFTRNYWSAVENERKILSEDSLIQIIDLFEFGKDDRAELLELREAAKEHGWWSRYSAILDDDLQRLFGLEHGAHSVRGYESLLIPGLLQTAEYATALMTPDVNLRQVEVAQRVESRMRRQDRLTGENPLRMTQLVSEAALRQEIGGPAVLGRQLDHVITMVERYPDTIDFRVIPFQAQSCGLFGAATVHLIDFENPRLPTLIWQETVTSWGIIDDQTSVLNISGTFRDGMRRALSSADSLKLLQNRIKELV